MGGAPEKAEAGTVKSVEGAVQKSNGPTGRLFHRDFDDPTPYRAAKKQRKERAPLVHIEHVEGLVAQKPRETAIKRPTRKTTAPPPAPRDRAPP